MARLSANSMSMNLRHAAALGFLMLGSLPACSPVEHHTDQQAAMAQMTFSPEKCESTGVLRYCNSEHSLPDASAGIDQLGHND